MLYCNSVEAIIYKLPKIPISVLFINILQTIGDKIQLTFCFCRRGVKFRFIKVQYFKNIAFRRQKTVVPIFETP